MVSVNTNLPQMGAISRLNQATGLANRSLERLSTGRRINRASDDPAGSVAVDQLRARERTIKAQIESIDRDEYRYGAREGAGSVVADLLTDLRVLVVRGANRAGLAPGEAQALQEEADSIIFTLDFLSNTATFEGEQLVTGFASSALGFVSADGPDERSYSLSDLRSGGRLNLVDGNIEKAGESIEAAVSGVASTRGAIGVVLNENAAMRESLLRELEGVSAEKGRILDTDYAAETAELVRTRVLQQVAAFVGNLAGRQSAQTVLALLSASNPAQPR